jgi:D-aminopeptidase
MPRARLRDLGLTIGTLSPGPFNAITDVAGVKVGYSTLIQDAPLVARTGVTAIWPRGPEIWSDYVFAGTFSFNGNGEMTGLPWLAEQGLLGAPIGITNTYQVGVVRDAITAIAGAVALRRPSICRSSPRPMTAGLATSKASH